ncbi:Hypothetical protein SRAE_2000230400 [Strongyloides ratti]|uniref:Uncharacterized protein n=1 Tax=Strongyloides ratti TaxID=34506 RepID=A0A090LHL2_STRRB|nr:Hypothetical protein SRAE_2000230400 [Strongyloides ratti]CEF67643.1 Hypothetical protein SRAE_2000230400 [Strongyloides ratti]
MSLSSLTSRNLEYQDDIYSKTVNIPVACFPEFSKQVRSLVHEYYNGECKLEGRLLFKGTGSVSKGNLSLGYLTSSSQDSIDSNSSYALKTSTITDPYSCCNYEKKNNKYKNTISTASEGISMTGKLQKIGKVPSKKHLPAIGYNHKSAQKSSTSDNTQKTESNTTIETSPEVFKKLRIYAHPDFMNLSTINKTSIKTTNKDSYSKSISSTNTTSQPIFDDIKMIFCRKTDITSINSRKSLTPVSFDTNGSPRRFS